jgi:hypothetical protein
MYRRAHRQLGAERTQRVEAGTGPPFGGRCDFVRPNGAVRSPAEHGGAVPRQPAGGLWAGDGGGLVGIRWLVRLWLVDDDMDNLITDVNVLISALIGIDLVRKQAAGGFWAKDGCCIAGVSLLGQVCVTCLLVGTLASRLGLQCLVVLEIIWLILK